MTALLLLSSAGLCSLGASASWLPLSWSSGVNGIGDLYRAAEDWGWTEPEKEVVTEEAVVRSKGGRRRATEEWGRRMAPWAWQDRGSSKEAFRTAGDPSLHPPTLHNFLPHKKTKVPISIRTANSRASSGDSNNANPYILFNRISLGRISKDNSPDSDSPRKYVPLNSMTLTSLYEKKKKQTSGEETYDEDMDSGTKKNSTASTETPLASTTSTTKIPWWAHTNKRKRPAPVPAPAPASATSPALTPASASQKASAPSIGPVLKSSSGPVALKYSQELPQRMRSQPGDTKFYYPVRSRPKESSTDIPASLVVPENSFILWSADMGGPGEGGVKGEVRATLKVVNIEFEENEEKEGEKTETDIMRATLKLASVDLAEEEEEDTKLPWWAKKTKIKKATLRPEMEEEPSYSTFKWTEEADTTTDPSWSTFSPPTSSTSQSTRGTPRTTSTSAGMSTTTRPVAMSWLQWLAAKSKSTTKPKKIVRTTMKVTTKRSPTIGTSIPEDEISTAAPLPQPVTVQYVRYQGTTVRAKSNIDEPFLSLLTEGFKYPGPPIRLPITTTTASTTPTTTRRIPTTGAPLSEETTTKTFSQWTWWMPEEEGGQDKGEDETEEGEEGGGEMGEKQQAWESAGVASHEETTEMKPLFDTFTEAAEESGQEAKNEAKYDSMEGDEGDGNPAGSTMTDTMTTVKTAALESEEKQNEMEELLEEDATDRSEPMIMADKDKVKGEEEKPDKSGMQEKYAELVAHNSRLVEILKTTLQLQTDLFSRILRYLFH